MKLQKDLREFIALLTSHQVEFVVVGGHAVAYHGYPRFTGDMDLFVRPSVENAKRLMTALVAFGFGSVGLTEAVFTKPDQVVQFGRPPNRIDLLTSISAVTFDEAWLDSEQAELDNLAVRILGRHSLLKNKRATRRAKDLADVEELEKISEKARTLEPWTTEKPR